MNILWPVKIFHVKVLLYVTDAALYMVKSSEALKVFLPKLVHVTSTAHELHRKTEFIKEKCKNVNLLIVYTKKIYF